MCDRVSSSIPKKNFDGSMLDISVIWPGATVASRPRSAHIPVGASKFTPRKKKLFSLSSICC